VEPISEFFVSTATAGQYLAAGQVLRMGSIVGWARGSRLK
jgi:hypothetical protein